jgi:hypothetical protein
MLATALNRDDRGIVMQTTTIPWPDECEEVVTTTDFLGLHDQAKLLAQRACPALAGEEGHRLKTDTFVGVMVVLSLKDRNERKPVGFKEFKGYEFTLEELQPPLAVAAE